MSTTLAPFAAHTHNSRGRRHQEAPSRFRNEFQRDRDRIIHSAAFRRLEYKTQVFVNHEGDLYRTRLTHSLEVAQVGRTVARELGLNEDLTEAICLAHDLGHTPFGHAGQHALNDCMRDYGGFEHNLQSLRVVDELEEKYPRFNGLNLTFETREGILKHCSNANAATLGDVGERFLNGTRPGLEAQLANVADEIAYNNHDVDDGLRSGLIDVAGLQQVALFGEHFEATAAQYPDAPQRIVVYETVRRMIGTVVNDLISASAARLAEARPANIDAVRLATANMIGLSDPISSRHLALKQFLREHLYRHKTVRKMTDAAQDTVRDLFARFMADPTLLPEQFAAPTVGAPKDVVARQVADYIAGMTDRYAIKERKRLQG